jgi:hypothetical protein
MLNQRVEEWQRGSPFHLVHFRVGPICTAISGRVIS